MLTKLLVLGILNRRKHYGYELKKTVEFEMRDFDIKFGSIYHAFKSFQKQGLIREVRIEQSDEGRPQRVGYEITEKGRRELEQLLLRAFGEEKPKAYNVEAALHFLDFDSIEKVIPILTERLRWHETEKAKLLQEKESRVELVLDRVEESVPNETSAREEENLDKARRIIPLLVTTIYDHKIALCNVEIEWTKNLIQQLERVASGKTVKYKT